MRVDSRIVSILNSGHIAVCHALYARMHAGCWLAASGDLGARGRNDGYCGYGGKRKRWCGRCTYLHSRIGKARHATETVPWSRGGLHEAPALDGSVAQRADQGSQDCLGRCDTSRPMKLPPSHPNQKNHPALPAPCSLLGGCLYFTRHALLLGRTDYVQYDMMAAPVVTSAIRFLAASLHLLRK